MILNYTRLNYTRFHGKLHQTLQLKIGYFFFNLTSSKEKAKNN